MLKAKSPDNVKPSKPKFLISGESGVGKTFFSLDFPKPYLIDTESGATRSQYQEKLKKVGGVYFGKEEGSQDFNAIIDEVKALTTTKHDYKTLIIDSFSYVYLLEAAEAELKGGSEFGRDKKEANKPTRQLIRWLDKLDMNVIIICHSKGKWKKVGKEVVGDGTTFDGYDKLEYILDLWIEILPGGKTFSVRKSRIESLRQGDSMPLAYDKFADVYGKTIIEKDAVPVVLANYAQLEQLRGLIESMNISQESQDKVMKTLDVDTWEELTEDQCQKVIVSLQDKIKKLAKGEKNGQTNS